MVASGRTGSKPQPGVLVKGMTPVARHANGISHFMETRGTLAVGLGFMGLKWDIEKLYQRNYTREIIT
jgi:P2-related tail formation protein